MSPRRYPALRQLLGPPLPRLLGEDAVLRALRFPRGALGPAAPPCIRQRALPRTAGAQQLPPARAPQRGLTSIAVVFRLVHDVHGAPHNRFRHIGFRDIA